MILLALPKEVEILIWKEDSKIKIIKDAFSPNFGRNDGFTVLFDGKYHAIYFSKMKAFILKINPCTLQEEQNNRSYLLRLLRYKWIFNNHLGEAIKQTVEDNRHVPKTMFL